MNLAKAITAHLAGDAALVALLATWHGAPAILTARLVPGSDNQPDGPYLLTAGNPVDAPWDTKTTRGRSVRRDVIAYAPATGSAALIDDIGERVRARLHRQAIPVDGHRTVVAEASGPVPVPDPDQQLYGRLVAVRFLIEENPDA